MIGLIIYLIGVVIAYVMHKQIVRREFDDNWSDVFLNFVLSLLSFITIIAIFLARVDKMFENIKLPKPPKWL